MALQEGTNPVLVAFRTGHTSTAIERHYGGLLEGFDSEVAQRLGAARRRSRQRSSGDHAGRDLAAPVSSLAGHERVARFGGIPRRCGFHFARSRGLDGGGLGFVPA